MTLRKTDRYAGYRLTEEIFAVSRNDYRDDNRLDDLR
jgi:hypothetical protein